MMVQATPAGVGTIQTRGVVFNTLWSCALFCLGLAVTRNWHDSVLDHYAVRCTMLPDPAPFPKELIRLANGNFTVKGLRELLVCELEPSPRYYIPLER
jgi:hypothetical protein